MERSRQLLPEMRGSILEGMICYSYFIIVFSLGWVLYEQVIGFVAFVVSQF